MNPLKNRWKVVGAGAAVAAIGIAGVGFAGGSSDVELPESINLRDRVPIAEAADGDQLATPEFQIVPAPVVGADSNTSSFDTNVSASVDSPDAGTIHGVETATASFDSPDAQVPQEVPSQQQFDSPATASFDSPATSFDSASQSG